MGVKSQSLPPGAGRQLESAHHGLALAGASVMPPPPSKLPSPEEILCDRFAIRAQRTTAAVGRGRVGLGVGIDLHGLLNKL
ncbi:MAG: hypothetical protein WDW36_008891 [Sanguina aurantia]